MRLQQIRYCLFLQGLCVCLVCGQGQEGVDSGSSPGAGLESSTSARTGSESDGYSIGGSASASTVEVGKGLTSTSSYDFNSTTQKSTSETPSKDNKTYTIVKSSTTTQSTITGTVTPTVPNESSTSSISTTTAVSPTTISTKTAGTTTKSQYFNSIASNYTTTESTPTNATSATSAIPNDSTTTAATTATVSTTTEGTTTTESTPTNATSATSTIPNDSTTTAATTTTVSTTTEGTTATESTPTNATSTIPNDSTTTAATTTTISTTTEGTTTEPPCICADLLNISILSTSKTSINLNVSLVYLTNGALCPTNITITCKANATLSPWIIPSGNSTLELSNNERYGQVEIKDLSEYTNYTCIGNESSGLSSEFSFTTKEEVPSEPLELSATPLSATSFYLTWKEPYKIPSILEGYRVNITRLEEASEGHFCCNCNGIERVETINVTDTDTNVTFNEALADFVYQITVEALSNVGYGNVTSVNVTTPISASEPPTNVSVATIEEVQEKNVLFTVNISWNMPCNTNGPANYFQIVLLGAYTLDNSVTYWKMQTVDILPNTTYYLCSFSDIFAASKYTVTIFAMTDTTRGIEHEEPFQTKTNFPSAPKINIQEVNVEDFTLTWMEPSNNPGNVENYILNIQGQGVNYNRSPYCLKNTTDIYNITQVTEFTYYTAIPDATYLIYLSAETARGQGNMTNVTISTNMTYPESFLLDYKYNSDHATEIYDDTVTLKFKPGCFNGKFEEIVVNYTGKRINFEDHQNTESNLSFDTETYTFKLQPEYSYDVTVTVRNEQFSTMNSTSFIAQAGVPKLNSSITKTIQIVPQESKTTIVLKKDDFDDSNGQVTWLAILVSDRNVTGGEYSAWLDNSQWPVPQKKDEEIYYQATPAWWKPFNGSNITNFTLGETKDCPEDFEYCNGELKPGTQYYVLIRIFNDYYYRNTMPIPFETLKAKRLGLILGVIFGLLAASCAAFAVFIAWRKGLIRVSYIERVDYYSGIQQSRDVSTALLSNSSYNEQIFERHVDSPSGLNTEQNRFIEHCKHLEDNPEALRAEWNDLEEKSKPIYEELPCHFAVLTQNQRKNRYSNILPFDHSRVKLNIDEDDEQSSDYINASYIKGYLNENAYIATQGPKPDTCRDFWKMILQENISIIVMVSKFIENNRDKCYKYFPKNRETMMIGDDIEVRCSMELDFGFYCIRTLQVKKELRQETVTHLQYLEWPDFGVPTGTDSMLQFCHQFKERWATLGGMALIHCSAGVGRTGTLIATDILLRNIHTGRKIDVFNTVLELRRQRKSMVQTQIQYMYIYQLIRSMLECLTLDEDDIPTEPVYANVDLSNRSRNGIVETAL